MSLDLSILEIAADIIDETGRGAIAEQVRELKGRIEQLVERIRVTEEQTIAMIKGYPSNLILAENDSQYGESPATKGELSSEMMDWVAVRDLYQIAMSEHRQRTAIRIQDVAKDSQ